MIYSKVTSRIGSALRQLLHTTSKTQCIRYLQKKNCCRQPRGLQFLQGASFDRDKLMQLITKQFYFGQSFEPYGGRSGLFDFGPLGTEILRNLVSEWHCHFVVHDCMLHVSTPVLIPEQVLKTSGHIDKFADYMVKDTVTGQCYRLDHLVKQHLEKKLCDVKISEDDEQNISSLLSSIDGMDVVQLSTLVQHYDIRAPVTGNAVTQPQLFNVMFSVNVGASDASQFYMRPETCQSIFLNFNKLFNYNNLKLPFAAAQVGLAFRNELNPQSKLLRMRQFTLAEIEHFCDPDKMVHSKFNKVSGEVLTLLSAATQTAGANPISITIGEAVAKGLVSNEILGYYMARIQLYLLHIGIDGDKLRFRQHLSNERAHYASDCWDAECLTSYGWVECVGCADRGHYDLRCHGQATGMPFTFKRTLKRPKEEWILVPCVNTTLVKKHYRGNRSKKVLEALAVMQSAEVEQLNQELEDRGVAVLVGCGLEVTRAMVPSVKKRQITVTAEDVVPRVVEPSFGMERIFYALLEHSFRVRVKDPNRTYCALPSAIAPFKVVVIPLSLRHLDYAQPYIDQIVSGLEACSIRYRMDDTSGSIGRRYTRNDSQATPFAVTVDFDTFSEAGAPTVTLRERDSMEQVRLPVQRVADAVQRLVNGTLTWTQLANMWPKFIQQENKMP